SEVGEGSTFTLYLPTVIGSSERVETSSYLTTPAPGTGAVHRVTRELVPVSAATAAIVSIDDDRDTIGGDDQAVLIIEDDPVFATHVLDCARQHGFKGVVATRGSDALQLARKFSFS